ncbi:preprotein translocase subunit SecY [Candidatus Saccharibacteria bacterium]|nr:preprotein translocase subunit SecY [Candidatus Saccharibacteria bacterium]
MNRAVLTQLYKDKDLRRRVLVVIGILTVYSLLAHVPVPVPDAAQLQAFLLRLFQSNPLLGFANLFSGGAMSNFSIILMGLGPFINASIIMQLLGQVVPSLEALQKEGEAGRKKINYYTRLLTVPLAIIQSVAMIAFVRTLSTQATGVDVIGRPSPFQWVLMVASISAGSIFLMWLGEIVTEYGIGNGISILIFAGIVSQLPTTIAQQFSLAQADTARLFSMGIIAILAFAVIVFIVYINEGQRNIPISYARRSTTASAYTGVDTHLPLRVITAGVIPIIFALAFLSVPGFIGQLFSQAKTAWLAQFATGLSNWFKPGNLIYSISYFALVVGFTYFYTAIIFKPAEIAENLQKQGGFIPGIRPGTETAKYLKRIIGRITLAGALALGIVAILPFILQAFIKDSSALLSIGGTGLLIVVAVVIETLKQVEAKALMATYEKY